MNQQLKKTPQELAEDIPRQVERDSVEWESVWSALDAVLKSMPLPTESGVPIKCDLCDFMLMGVSSDGLAQFKNKATRRYLMIGQNGSATIPCGATYWRNEEAPLTLMQKAVLKHYMGGEFAHLESMCGAEEAGDGLLTFLLREISQVVGNDNDSNAVEVSVRALHAASDQVLEVANAIGQTCKLPTDG